MKAEPIIAGALYRVTHNGQSRNVPAVNAADALAKILEGL